MTMAPIYTDAELRAKIQAIDVKLDKAVSESELDTTQNRQTFEIEVAELRKQKEYYINLRGQAHLCNTGGSIITLQKGPRTTPWGY